MIELMVLSLFFGLIWAAIGYWLAGEKNRNQLGWAFVCLLIGIFGIILLAIAGRKD